MNIKPGTVLKGLDGQAIMDGGIEMTLGAACERALQVVKAKDGQAGYQQFILAERIHNAPSGLDLPAEDIVIIKRCIGEAYLPALIGPAFRELEGDSEKPD